MTWPQIAILFLLATGFVIQCVANIRDRDHSTAVVTIVILWEIVYRSAFVMILHAGGFW